MVNEKISLPVIKRLPRYHRYVLSLKQKGVSTISSSELATLLGTTASQVRQDFNCFGGFGQQGIGYNVENLCEELEKLLFSGKELDTILIGTGRLGRAVSHYIAGEARGYRLNAAFDKDHKEIGRLIGGDIIVQDVHMLPTYCKQHNPQVAVLCIPEQSAAEMAPTLLELGIKGYWNFSHYDLTAQNSDVVVENVHLGDSLMSLGYRMRHTR